MTCANTVTFLTLLLATSLCQAFVATTCDSSEASCRGSVEAALQPTSLLQKQHAKGTSSLHTVVEDMGHCGEQRIIPLPEAWTALNELTLEPETKELGFIYIPQNGAKRIESLGLKNGLKWGFNAINHTYFQKIQLTDHDICTWHLVPPRYLQGVKVYTNKPLFCVTRDPLQRFFSTYLSLIRMLDDDCPMAQKDLEILTHYDRCSPESLNYFATKALSGSEYDFDCNLMQQSTYIWDWDGTQICKEIIRFEELPTALPALFAKYNIGISEPQGLPSLLQAVEKVGTTLDTEGSVCPGLKVADFNENAQASIRDYYHHDYKKLGYN